MLGVAIVLAALLSAVEPRLLLLLGRVAGVVSCLTGSCKSSVTVRAAALPEAGLAAASSVS